MNNASGILRKLLILLTTLIILVVLLIVFQFTDVAFRVWDRLQNTPSGFLVLYLLGVAVIAGAGGLLLYRIWTVGREGADVCAAHGDVLVVGYGADVEGIAVFGMDGAGDAAEGAVAVVRQDVEIDEVQGFCAGELRGFVWCVHVRAVGDVGAGDHAACGGGDVGFAVFNGCFDDGIQAGVLEFLQ